MRIVPGVNTPDKFTCQLLDHQDQLESLLHAIAASKYEVGVTQDGLACVDAEVCVPVCACRTRDDTWQRGKVVSTGTHTHTVLYIDHGDTEDLPLQRIKLLEERFASLLPPQTITCCLPVLLESDVNSDHPPSTEAWELDWPPGTIRHFANLTSGGGVAAGDFYLEPMTVGEDGVFVVRLRCGQLNVREALLAKMRDPALHVISQTIADKEDPLDGGEGTGQDVPTQEIASDAASRGIPQQETTPPQEVVHCNHSSSEDGSEEVVASDEVSSLHGCVHVGSPIVTMAVVTMALV